MEGVGLYPEHEINTGDNFFCQRTFSSTCALCRLTTSIAIVASLYLQRHPLSEANLEFWYDFAEGGAGSMFVKSEKEVPQGLGCVFFDPRPSYNSPGSYIRPNSSGFKG